MSRTRLSGTTVEFRVLAPILTAIFLLFVPAVQAATSFPAAMQSDAFASLPVQAKSLLPRPDEPNAIPFTGLLAALRELLEDNVTETRAKGIADAIVADADRIASRADDDDQGNNAPSFAIHDFRPGCDVNHDGIDDMFLTAFGNFYQGNFYTVTRAVSGGDGRALWSTNNGPYVFANILPRGLPTGEYLQPANWDPAETDVNGKGACDVLVLAVDRVQLVLTTAVNLFWFKFYWHIAMLEGSTGQEIWRDDEVTDIIIVLPRSFLCGDAVVRITNFPTNFDHFNTPRGPRYALITHDWSQTTVNYDCPNDSTLNYYVTVVNISVFASSTNTMLFRRTIERPSPIGLVVYVLRGESDLMGADEHGPEKEILLDRFDPDTGQCTLKTLRGRDGGDFWEVAYSRLPGQRGQFPNGEETVEGIVWCLSYFLPDLTGDGIQEVMGSILGMLVFESTTYNGAFRTHWNIFYGHNGKTHWNKDIRNQGWGYLQSLDPRDGPRSDPGNLVGTFLTDPPQFSTPGDRFPPKWTHQNTLQLETGIPLHSFDQPWAQWTNLIWEYTLYQYLGDGAVFPYGSFSGGAPADITGDGVLDPLSPADYLQPSGPVQVLLSSQAHRYHSMEAEGGESLATLNAWSGAGVAMTCNLDDGTVMVVSGHSRRIDLTHFDLRTGRVLERVPLYNDSRPQAMTAGRETIFLTPTCHRMPDGPTLFGFNLGTLSLQRGLENVAIHGFLEAEGSLSWVVPELNGRPPLEPSLDLDFLLHPLEEQVTPGEKIFILASPAIPGGAAGIGVASAIGRHRRKRRGGA